MPVLPSAVEDLVTDNDDAKGVVHGCVLKKMLLRHTPASSHKTRRSQSNILF
jgi:hypothetical protein